MDCHSVNIIHWTHTSSALKTKSFVQRDLYFATVLRSASNDNRLPETEKKRTLRDSNGEFRCQTRNFVVVHPCQCAPSDMLKEKGDFVVIGLKQIDD